MKKNSMLVFLLIVLVIYFLINFYIFLKGYSVITGSGNSRLIYTIVFIALTSTFIAAKFLERSHSNVLSDILNIIGGFWLAFMLYAFLLLLLSDIIYLILRIPGIAAAGFTHIFRKWSFMITVAFSVVLITGGFINAVIPVVRKYNIEINKPVRNIRSLKIAAVSDIHLGSIIRKRSIIVLSKMLQKIKPDIIFLLGDIVDGEIGPVLRGDLLNYFKWPESKYGLFAITGNHEFIGGAWRTIPYIEQKGIRILKDEVITLDAGIQLVGRIDRDGARYNQQERLPLEELIKKTYLSKPIIVLDHQPLKLDETEKSGVDLQLSGHTHNGQMWPLNQLIKMFYEVTYGFKKKGKSQIIVSSGFGIWGPRIRSGSRSEVLEINITFSGTDN